VNSQKLPVDDSCQGKQIEAFHEFFVNFLVVFVKALRSEIEKGSHLAALVVASQKVDRVREPQLSSSNGAVPLQPNSNEKLL
jgi:hypothetical protein